jgi:glycosyltransferase involved in cell wall biosynthesis
VLVEGLTALGAEVVEHHRPVWEGTRHKAGGFLRPDRLARAGVDWGASWVALSRGLGRLGPIDAVVAGYPAQPDALPAKLAARRLGAPLIVDAMISLADTLGGDRGRVGRLGSGLLAGIDWQALRVADVVMADTTANADWLATRFRIPRGRVRVVPVGAEASRFPAAPPPSGAPSVLFYGKLAPLHGIETILAAARLPGVPPIRIIGDGQLGGWLSAELSRDTPAGLSYTTWVPYEGLAGEIANASVCLGVFGTSDKASRVVPNKVFQAMAVGRPVVSADTPGLREVVRDGVEGLLVPPGDADALAAAIRTLASDADLRARMGATARERFLRIGHPERVAARFLDAIGPVLRH